MLRLRNALLTWCETLICGSDRFRDAVPGGATGKVIVTSYQVITDPRTGRKQEVPITAVDTDAVHVKLAILKRVAQVLGQRGKSVESAGADRLNELVEIVKRGAAPAPQGTDYPGGGGGAGSPTGNPEAGDAEPRAVGGEGRVSVMPIKKIPWKWTKKRELAARLVAEDELPDCEIAQKVGVSQPTIYVWRAKPEFMARVDELVAAYRKQIRITSIGLVENRIARMDRELELLKQVEAERARVLRRGSVSRCDPRRRHRTDRNQAVSADRRPDDGQNAERTDYRDGHGSPVRRDGNPKAGRARPRAVGQEG